MAPLTSSYLATIKPLLVATLALFALSSQANQVNGFTESYSDTVKVSGQFLKGLQYADAQFETTPHIYFPRAYSGTICVFVSSADGRYKSQYQYSFAEPVEGLIAISFPTQYKEELSAFTSNELGLLATVQDDCKQTNGRYLVSAWGKPKSLNSISIFIRSNARRDIAVPRATQASPNPVKCQDLNSSYRVSYDKECIITNVSADALQQVVIKRRNLRAIPDELIEFYR
ncbi:hypothetical protein [Idiomarina aminovorans]|uniref:hypothetical protein n=1 Tax=Idiomarina aminovorans TaxID=2914829 RepID=UPI00200580CF|nr:hypothetical protein [Idiomarina sp. ATCH4]MCK7460206.1 hypothetical protein [Idiomarina sp. ATCH4]